MSMPMVLLSIFTPTVMPIVLKVIKAGFLYNIPAKSNSRPAMNRSLV